jgi:hypothetical protein
MIIWNDKILTHKSDNIQGSVKPMLKALGHWTKTYFAPKSHESQWIIKMAAKLANHSNTDSNILIPLIESLCYKINRYL